MSSISRITTRLTSMAAGLGLLGLISVGVAPSHADECNFGQINEGSCKSLMSGNTVLTLFDIAGNNSAVNGVQRRDTVSLTNDGLGTYTIYFDFLGQGQGIKNTDPSIRIFGNIAITDPSTVFDIATIDYNGGSASGTRARAIYDLGPTVTTRPTASSGTFDGFVSSTDVRFVFVSPSNSSPINTVTLTLTQKPVPGPLPLIGAGTAFVFTRKLRRRIRLVA